MYRGRQPDEVHVPADLTQHLSLGAGKDDCPRKNNIFRFTEIHGICSKDLDLLYLQQVLGISAYR